MGSLKAAAAAALTCPLNCQTSSHCSTSRCSASSAGRCSCKKTCCANPGHHPKARCANSTQLAAHIRGFRDRDRAYLDFLLQRAGLSLTWACFGLWVTLPPARLLFHQNPITLPLPLCYPPNPIIFTRPSPQKGKKTTCTLSSPGGQEDSGS